MSFFSNKTVVITGGSGVLGREIAGAFAKKGASVALIGRTESTLFDAAEEIVSKGGNALAFPADVLDVKTLHKAHEEINLKFGPCSILINGAGGNHPTGTTSQSFFSSSENDPSETSFFDLDSVGVKHVFDLNFMGSFLPTQIFAKDMVGKKNCSILNISSVSASLPLTKVSSYSAAKAAISNFTQWLAVHMSKENIRVNALAPGFFLTDQNRSLLTNENGSLSNRGEQILQNTPMGRFGDPADLTGGALWLCGDEAKFVTGVILHIDGGFTAYSGV